MTRDACHVTRMSSSSSPRTCSCSTHRHNPTNTPHTFARENLPISDSLLMRSRSTLRRISDVNYASADAGIRMQVKQCFVSCNNAANSGGLTQHLSLTHTFLPRVHPAQTRHVFLQARRISTIKCFKQSPHDIGASNASLHSWCARSN